MNEYKVYYMNVFQRSFSNRDEALDHVLLMTLTENRSYGDYEILDGSDFL
jgi:hypothetical protein